MAGAAAPGPPSPGAASRFSLGWRFEQGAGFLAGLSLAVGVAVARALEDEGFANIALKWPNDLIHRHLKVGGILIELNGDALGPSVAVIGIGLNVRLPRERQGATSRTRSPISRTSPAGARRRSTATGCWRGSIAELARVLDQYATRGLRAVRRRVAASPRVPGQAGQAAAARRRRGDRQGRRRRRQRARWCWPTARAARASCRAKSRCGAPERRGGGESRQRKPIAVDLHSCRAIVERRLNAG